MTKKTPTLMPQLSDLSYTTEHYANVRYFMSQIPSQCCPELPEEPTEEVRALRARLLLEECLETIHKGLGVRVTFHNEPRPSELLTGDMRDYKFHPVNKFNMVETVDGCCDLKVVTTGTLIACGMPDHCFQQVVDYNNLAKFGPGHTIDAGGKLIKPPDHKPPDLEPLLEQLGWMVTDASMRS